MINNKFHFEKGDFRFLTERSKILILTNADSWLKVEHCSFFSFWNEMLNKVFKVISVRGFTTSISLGSYNLLGFQSGARINSKWVPQLIAGAAF